jgi:hypothetical protein
VCALFVDVISTLVGMQSHKPLGWSTRLKIDFGETKVAGLSFVIALGFAAVFFLAMVMLGYAGWWGGGGGGGGRWFFVCCLFFRRRCVWANRGEIARDRRQKKVSCLGKRKRARSNLGVLTETHSTATFLFMF